MASCFFSTTTIFDLCSVRETCFASNNFSFSSMSSNGLWTGSGNDGSIFPGNGTANLHRRATVVGRVIETSAMSARERIVDIFSSILMKHRLVV